MKKLILITALALAGCNNSASSPTYKMLSYEELVGFQTSCTDRDNQQKHLKYILDRKGFNPNPDNLSADDRAYNSRLKATLWWYEYRCAVKTQVATSFVGKLDTPKATQVKSEVVRNGDCQSRMSVTLDKDDETVSANTLTVCGKTNPLEEEPKVKIGETVFETDLPKVNEIQPVYFKHRHSTCRLFRERYMMNNVLEVNHGVVCQTDPNMDTWSVVDKW
jgi:hypothetical protein